MDNKVGSGLGYIHSAQAADREPEEHSRCDSRAHHRGGEFDDPFFQRLKALLIQTVHDGQGVATDAEVTDAFEKGADQSLPYENVDEREGEGAGGEIRHGIRGTDAREL